MSREPGAGGGEMTDVRYTEAAEPPEAPVEPRETSGQDADERMRERIRAGDKEAFAELYDDEAKAVYNHAFRLTGDWSVAEEVMAETFLDAWRTRRRVEPEGGSLRPWLLGVATNKARNQRRSLGRRLAFLTSQPPPREVEDFAEATAARVDDARELSAVGGALRHLRPREREVLTLCVWAGLDYAQAAAALEVPVGTVRSRLSRARARLRRLVARQSGAREREPGAARGEVLGRAAFASLPVEEEVR